MTRLRMMALLVLGVQMCLVAEGQDFLVSQNGKKVGSAKMNLTPTGGGRGYELTSGTKIKMDGLDYSFNATATLDGSYRLVQEQLSGVVNKSAATVMAARSGNGYSLRINADGQVTNQPQAYHQRLVLMPDFDPGSLAVLLKLSTMGSGQELWALIPKQTGIESALKVVTDGNERGTLKDLSMVVRHVTVTSDTIHVEIFSSPSGELLQAEWPDQAFALVRDGFRLAPPLKAPAAPPPPPPQSEQPQQTQQPQQPQGSGAQN